MLNKYVVSFTAYMHDEAHQTYNMNAGTIAGEAK